MKITCRGLRAKDSARIESPSGMEIIRRKLIPGMLVSLFINITVCPAQLQEREKMDIHNATLWQVIDTLINQPYHSPDKIKQVLPTDFSERSRNGVFSFNDGGPLRLADQVEIKINLRFKIENKAIGMITLNLIPDAICVTRNEVFAHYPDVIPSQEAHGLFTYWTTYPPEGKLSFGFKESSRECLASVVINRIDPGPAQNHQHPIK